MQIRMSMDIAEPILAPLIYSGLSVYLAGGDTE